MAGFFGALEEKQPGFQQKYGTAMDYLDPAGLVHGQPIEPIYMGGSADEQARLQEQYRQGIAMGGATQAAGIGVAGQGVGMLTDASAAAGADRIAAQAYGAQGQGIGAAGMSAQDRAIRGMLDAAKMDTASAAERQMLLGANQTAATMQAQAASARGGNQAAAIRGAQATGAQAYTNIMANAGILRAQEDAARANRIAAAQQAAAGAYGQRSAMGYGMQGQGLGYGLQSTQQQAGIGGQVADVGLGVGQLGTQTQGQFLDAQASSNAAMMDAEMRRRAAELEQKGGIVGGMWSGITSLASGGGGGK